VIARVTPEHKVRLVDTLKAKGHITAMTGDGVNDAPALKRADIGIAMGITGTEVSKEAAAMILTDDDFSTIVKAVELGRGLYDNLAKYIRFQMGCLVGFIVTFLGASIFNIVSGVPFLPLQTLYVNFTTQVAQAVGLGYGKPSEGLMERKPRPTEEPILPRALLLWLVIAGTIMGLSTLGLIWGVDDNHGAQLARTMGLTSFAFMNVFFSFAAKSEKESVFSLETFSDRKFLIATGVSLVAIILGTEFSVFQRFLSTEPLSFRQWLLCIGAALPVLAASEIRKWLLRRQEHGEVQPAAASA
jgi:Ca2+-transporting ATPase